MNLYQNILNKLRRLSLNIMFGFKKVDDEVFSQKADSDTVSNGIQQNISEERVAHHMLKGEVTKEVAELRYRNYKVIDNSRCFQVYADGSSKKNNVNWKYDDFTILNKEYCNSIVDTLNNKLNKHTIVIDYDDIPKFRLETYCNKVKVKDKTIQLYFIDIANDLTLSKPFLNELKKQIKKIEHCDFDHLKQLSFLTQNVKNVKDNMRYEYHNLKLESIRKNRKKEYILTYQAKNVLISDLTDRFFSEEMEQKYLNKEIKQPNSISEIREKCVCGYCGQEMTVIDGDITEATFGAKICNDCLRKSLENQIKN